MKLFVLTGLLVLAAAGCGSSSSGGNSTSSDVPACSTVWVNGKTLPSGYMGCTIPSSSSEQILTSVPCKAGGQISFLTLGSLYYWVKSPGGTISSFKSAGDDPAYKAAYNACSG
jgi:hypothetical protein